MHTLTQTHTMDHYSALRKKILPFRMTQMIPQKITVSQISQTHEEKYNISNIESRIQAWERNKYKERMDSGYQKEAGWEAGQRIQSHDYTE